MSEATWELSDADGSVVVHTGVAGRAARTGHRLTIEAQRWSASVTWEGDTPTAIAATIPVDSLQIMSGSGGLTPLSGAEKAVARANALKSMAADKFPEVTYETSAITGAADSYHAEGTLTIHGRRRPHSLDFTVADAEDGWVITTETTIIQTDFGIKPYSLMMGALKVADDVQVTIEVRRAMDA